MVIQELQLSRKQVRKAGDKLKLDNLPLEEKNNALFLMSEWRDRHNIPMSLAYRLTKNIVKEHDKTAYFGQRLKRADSIIKKLKRFPNTKLDNMQDIAGCRAVVKNAALLAKVNDDFNSREKDKRSPIQERVSDYINRPKEDGYRGIHRIYKYQGDKSYCKNLKAEIQLRTRLQHSWATAVEIIDTFESQNLKIGGGSNDWKRFFFLVSDELARKEKIKTFSDKPQIEEIRELNNKLKAIDKLKGYRVSAHHIENITKDTYFILKLMLDKRIVNISRYYSQEEAKDIYISLEQGLSSNYNLVLVKSDSIQGLKKAFPNYFADSSLFVETLELLLS